MKRNLTTKKTIIYLMAFFTLTVSCTEQEVAPKSPTEQVATTGSFNPTSPATITATRSWEPTISVSISGPSKVSANATVTLTMNHTTLYNPVYLWKYRMTRPDFSYTAWSTLDGFNTKSITLQVPEAQIDPATGEPCRTFNVEYAGMVDSLSPTSWTWGYNTKTIIVGR